MYLSFEALPAAKHSVRSNMDTSNDPLGSLTLSSWMQLFTSWWLWTEEFPSGRISRNCWKLLSSVVLNVTYLGLASFNKHCSISGPLWCCQFCLTSCGTWRFYLLIPSLSAFRVFWGSGNLLKSCKSRQPLKNGLDAVIQVGVFLAVCTLSWHDGGIGIEFGLH